MSAFDIAKIFLILGAMLGVMYLLLYLVKKYLYSAESKGKGTLNVEVISTSVILPKKYVSLVRVKDKIYMLGIADGSVNLIDKLDYETIALNEESSDEKPNFYKLLKSNMGLK